MNSRDRLVAAVERLLEDNNRRGFSCDCQMDCHGLACDIADAMIDQWAMPRLAAPESGTPAPAVESVVGDSNP